MSVYFYKLRDDVGPGVLLELSTNGDIYTYIAEKLLLLLYGTGDKLLGYSLVEI